MRQNEALVKRKVREILKRHGGGEAWFCFPVAGPYGRAGVPDILAVVNGVFLAVETKSGRNKPTKLQKQQLRKIRTAGGLSMVVNEQNLPEFERLVQMAASQPTHAVLSYSQGRWSSLIELF